MQVQDLIELLQREDPEMEVMSEYNYGDYHRTRALNHIECVELMAKKETAYSDSGFAIDEDGDGGEEDERLVIVLSS